MAVTAFQFRKRLAGQTAGSPATLRSAEPAYNMTDGKLYVGFGDNGSGVATSIKVFGKDDFIANVPAGGTSGQALVKNSGADGDWGWGTVSSGGTTYTASNDGITLAGTQFSLNYSQIDTGLTLTTRLAGKANTSHTHDAADIATGTLAVARIPNLDAGKITTGAFADARIPNLDAAKITTGVFDIARIPVLPSQTVQVSSGAISALTAGQQSNIAAGTVVTTSDGRRWVYNGSGSKTVEASYTELADITPEWSVIANKPSFATVATSGSYTDLTNRPALATVATSGSYNDLTNRPTLGTMASQNASAVAITGGTIDGVVLDGGTF